VPAIKAADEAHSTAEFLEKTIAVLFLLGLKPVTYRISPVPSGSVFEMEIRTNSNTVSC
jgi:hypothetical protein